MSRNLFVLLTAVVVFATGCTLTEVRNKWSGGPEFRHDDSTRTNSVRWSVGTGVEFAWEDAKGHKYTSGVSYRRRDVSDGDGDNDNGVWVDFSFPLWKKPKKPDPSILELQQELAHVKKQVEQLAAANAEAPTETR